MTNPSRITLASDHVFSDGSSLQIPTISGSAADRIAAGLTVAINV